MASKSSIELSWTLGCLGAHIVSEYVIKYCAVAVKLHRTVHHSQVQNCTSASITKIIKHEPTYGWSLTGLTPYTWYMIEIQLIADHYRGPVSDPYTVQTIADVPSSPRYLNFSDVTNTTVRLSWRRPEFANGQLNAYLLKSNEDFMNIPANYSEYFVFLLKGLDSFTNYSARVKACTDVDCSEYSNEIQFETRIGTPREISQLNKIESENRVSWMPPTSPGGPVDYYELKQIIMDNDAQRTVEKIVKIKGTHCTLVHCDCRSGSFSVRAVNVVRPYPSIVSSFLRSGSTPKADVNNICIEQEDDFPQHFENYTLLPAAWSNPLQILCESGYSFFIYVPLVIIIFIGLSIFGSFALKRRLTEMMNIAVVMPPGLEDIKHVLVLLPRQGEPKTRSTGNLTDDDPRLTDSDSDSFGDKVEDDEVSL